MERDARQVLDIQFHEMRWRVLSLAADLDRIERAPGGEKVLAGDPRMKDLRACLTSLLEQTGPGRAERVQLILSDASPPPPKA